MTKLNIKYRYYFKNVVEQKMIHIFYAAIVSLKLSLKFSFINNCNKKGIVEIKLLVNNKKAALRAAYQF